MKISHYLPQLGALLLLMGLTVPAFAYAAGYFGGGKAVGSTTTSPGSLGATSTVKPSTGLPNPVITPGTDKEEVKVYLDNLSKAMSSDRIDGLTENRLYKSLSERKSDADRLLAFVDDYESGLLLTTDDYDPERYAFTRILTSDLPYACGTEEITVYSKKESNLEATYTTVATKVTVERKSVQPYMGFLIFTTELDGSKPKTSGDDRGQGSAPSAATTTGAATTTEAATTAGSADSSNPKDPVVDETTPTKITLCDSFGNLLLDDITGYSPAYSRDKKDRPVFNAPDGGYAVYDGKKGAMVAIPAGEIRIGLNYDFPALPYGENGLELTIDENGDYRYVRTSNGKYRFNNYFRAFNFSEGAAIVKFKLENRVIIIGSSGAEIFKPKTWYYFHTGVVGQRMAVGDRYALPDTFGIESIGCQGFDHGYLRLRVITSSNALQSLGKIVRDEYRLVDKNGKTFEIPEGYTLEGYSDGVLLLQKNGKYGYYTIDHKWIAQPLYSYATPFIQGLAVVGFTDGTVGMIDTEGNIVLPFVFTSLSTPSSGIVVGYNEAIGYQVYAISEKSTDAD